VEGFFRHYGTMTSSIVGDDKGKASCLLALVANNDEAQLLPVGSAPNVKHSNLKRF
jgi:hypothetical protein